MMSALGPRLILLNKFLSQSSKLAMYLLLFMTILKLVDSHDKMPRKLLLHVDFLLAM